MRGVNYQKSTIFFSLGIAAAFGSFSGFADSLNDSYRHYQQLSDKTTLSIADLLSPDLKKHDHNTVLRALEALVYVSFQDGEASPDPDIWNLLTRVALLNEDPFIREKTLEVLPNAVQKASEAAKHKLVEESILALTSQRFPTEEPRYRILEALVQSVPLASLASSLAQLQSSTKPGGVKRMADWAADKLKIRYLNDIRATKPQIRPRPTTAIAQLTRQALAGEATAIRADGPSLEEEEGPHPIDAYLYYLRATGAEESRVEEVEKQVLSHSWEWSLGDFRSPMERAMKEDFLSGDAQMVRRAGLAMAVHSMDHPWRSGERTGALNDWVLPFLVRHAVETSDENTRDIAARAINDVIGRSSLKKVETIESLAPYFASEQEPHRRFRAFAILMDLNGGTEDTFEKTFSILQETNTRFYPLKWAIARLLGRTQYTRVKVQAADYGPKGDVVRLRGAPHEAEPDFQRNELQFKFETSDLPMWVYPESLPRETVQIPFKGRNASHSAAVLSHILSSAHLHSPVTVYVNGSNAAAEVQNHSMSLLQEPQDIRVQFGDFEPFRVGEILRLYREVEREERPAERSLIKRWVGSLSRKIRWNPSAVSKTVSACIAGLRSLSRNQ